MKTTCEKVRELLGRFHDNELREDDYQVVVDHLHSCDGCSREMAKLERISDAVRKHYETISSSEDFSGVWARIAPDTGGTVSDSPPWWSSIGRIFWRPRSLWAAAAAVAAALILLFAYLPNVQKPAVAANDCIIDKVESENSSVMVYETGDTKMKIIWVIDQQNGDTVQEGVTS
jgi:anti-sigma factor RsiW